MQHFGGASLAALAGDPRVGTPAYVHDLDAMRAEARELERAFGGRPHLVCYAVKANSAGPVVRALAAERCGADVVSGPELMLALECGVRPEKIVYSGVAKTDAELDLAIARGIRALQVESVEELGRVEARARAAGRCANVAVRVNPGLDEVGTHEHIATGHDDAKFGVPLEDVARALDAARAGAARGALRLVGLTSHVGSQLVRTDEYVQAARILLDVATGAHGLEFVDTGGGFGIDYGDGCAARPADFVRAALAELDARGLGRLALHVEPGRALVGAHVVLLASVVQLKETRTRRWMMIDAGMNDLVRPALYRALHRVVAVDGRAPPERFRVVGPVCESSDDFGFHELPRDATLVALRDAGAYGYTMASRYNGRALPAEAFLSGGAIAAVTPRKPPEDWVRDRCGEPAAKERP